MKFNPTFDYGKEDLRNEDNLVLWKFGELIKTLITLSSSAERQAEIIGFGAVADEMAIDFDTYFTLPFREYLRYKLLNDATLEKLKQLDLFLEERNGEKCPDFWDDSQLATNKNWEEVRNMAKDILEIMGMDNLTIEFDRQEKYKETEQGKSLVSQWTKSRLVKQ